MAAMCVGGGPVDGDGVCVEHGESACVIGVEPARWRLVEELLQEAPRGVGPAVKDRDELEGLADVFK